MKIAVIGMGGVGGYFGGKLCHALEKDRESEIYFIARNEHLAEIRKNGLILDSDEGIFTCVPTAATDDLSELPELDYCLICVKGYDLEQVLSQLKSKITDRTVILPLLNGVDIHERIRSVISGGTVLPSCVYVGTHIEKPGTVTQRGGTCTIHLGPDPAGGTGAAGLKALLDRGNIKYIWRDDPREDIWSKFVFIAAYGLVTACYNKTIGEILASEELTSRVRSIMEEICSIASARGVILPPSIVEDSLGKGGKFPFEAKTSFQRDFEKTDKPDERDLFGGTILRMGKELGIPVEATEGIYRLLSEQKPLPGV